jgi:hypothetical protein
MALHLKQYPGNGYGVLGKYWGKARRVRIKDYIFRGLEYKICYFSREITALVGVCEWNGQNDTKQKLIEVYLAGISAGIPDTQTEASRFFPQSLQEDAGLIPQLGNGRIFSDPSTSFSTIAQSSDCTVWWQSITPLSILNQKPWFTGKCLRQSCFYLDTSQFRTNFIRAYSDLSAAP